MLFLGFGINKIKFEADPAEQTQTREVASEECGAAFPQVDLL